jgi:hypothetical protein
MLKIDKWITFTKDLLPLVMDGRKTVTRRVIPFVSPEWELNPVMERVYTGILEQPFPWRCSFKKQHIGKFGVFVQMQTHVDDYATTFYPCPYGGSGDILGIKEGYRIGVGSALNGYVHGQYLVDNEWFHCLLATQEWDKWRARKFPYRATPGRFMYRSLARTRLLNKGVRVERVQDITDADAIAEGVQAWPRSYWIADVKGKPIACLSGPRAGFAQLWDSINKKRGFGWDVNPWVWRTEFEAIA